MDNQKVEQVLKEIFDKCGKEIAQNRKKFTAAVFDLLDEWNYRDERTVLKHAIESDALPVLLAAAQITGDAAERAVEQLKKESHMKDEDAEFVVRCVIAACGGNPDIVTENARRRQAEEERKRQEAERKRWEEEQQRRREEEERQRQEEERRRREEERIRREEEQKRREEERQHQEVQNHRKKEPKKKQGSAKIGILGVIGIVVALVIVFGTLSGSKEENSVPPAPGRHEICNVCMGTGRSDGGICPKCKGTGQY